MRFDLQYSARAILASAFVSITACASGGYAPASATSSVAAMQAGSPPPAAPARWMGLIGEYGPDDDVHMVLERDGRLWIRTLREEAPIVVERSESDLGVLRPSHDTARVLFTRGADGRATQMRTGGLTLARRPLGPESGTQLVVTPVRPMAELRREALAASPPAEAGPFRPSDLVELTTLDPTIKLEIRYATNVNLFGTPFYTQARAFLQRPAAEALVRVNAALRPMGYGLLIHDGYRPWSVTKMFWEAAPLDKRMFVANPARGSRHNRGEAVDLSLYDLATGTPIEMVGTYDETSPRSFPDYPGGTSRQRWHRALLRRVMEAEQFTVNDNEWWHFDYRDWQKYAIGNVAFEEIGTAGKR